MSMSQINLHIVAYNRRKRGLTYSAAHGDFKGAVADFPELLDEAKAERQRLADEDEGRGGRSGLFQRDVESKTRYEVLGRMIADAEREITNG